MMEATRKRPSYLLTMCLFAVCGHEAECFLVSSSGPSSSLSTPAAVVPCQQKPVFSSWHHQQQQQQRPKKSAKFALSALDLSPRQMNIIISADHGNSLAPWEAWCLLNLETYYRKALQLHCPFLRRRASDALDAVEQVLRFMIIRHKSLELIGPPVGWRCEGEVCVKEKNLPTAVVMERIRADWRPDNNKGYYITGRLSTELYRDDCFFDGPDPDMPVQGLRKYLNAASQLFETKSSMSELLELNHDPDTDLIHATWRMNGVLRLPWRPKLPEWTGTTTYHRDADGLIYKHTETWDMSVSQAFLKTLWPELANKIWADLPMDAAAAAAAVEDDTCTVEYI